MLATHSANNLDISERRSAELIGRWLDAVGLPADCWPVDLADAAAILRDGGEYNISPDELRDLGERGQVPAVASWDARDVLTAAACLEGRRQWRLTPSAHDLKKTQSRLALELATNAGADGIEALREQLAGYDLRLLLVLLCEADNRELREKMLSLVEASLIIASIDHA